MNAEEFVEALDGDNQVTAAYNGVNTPNGDIILVRH